MLRSTLVLILASAAATAILSSPDIAPAWIGWTVHGLGFIACGLLTPRHEGWLAAGLVFLPAVLVGISGAELPENDEGLPLVIWQLIAIPAHLTAFIAGYGARATLEARDSRTA